MDVFDPYVSYVFFNIHTRMPEKMVRSDNFNNVEASKTPDNVYVAMTDSTGWQYLRLVDINTLETIREEEENG